jgi:putative ABC transport system permease protein
MNQWLETFAYHISVEAWMFFAAGAFAIALALLTVSIQTVKAAFTNPTESLRGE